jgi:hypothetical protein
MKKYSWISGLFIVLAISIYSGSSIVVAEDGDSAKSISIDQICEMYIDYPMTADDLYQGKLVKTTVEVSSVKRILAVCSEDDPEGSFTMEITNKQGTILECVCNAPVYKSVLHNTPSGSKLNVEGTYRSMTGSYSEGESKQCKVTLDGCSFK